MRVSLAHIFTLTALTAFAGVGSIQAAQQGRFHLPTGAHWGRAVLEPGDYVVSLPELSGGQSMFIVQGEGKRVFELPLMDNYQQYSNSSYLTLKKIDGEYFVTAFQSGSTGKTFDFYTPKPKHRQLMSHDANGDLALAVK